MEIVWRYYTRLSTPFDHYRREINLKETFFVRH